MQQLWGTSLLNVTYKIFANNLAKYIEPYAKQSFGDYQSGFRKNRSKTVHILTLRMLYEKFCESNKYFHQQYVDVMHAMGSDRGSFSILVFWIAGLKTNILHRIIESTPCLQPAINFFLNRIVIR
jgi:hypothetical protein